MQYIQGDHLRALREKQGKTQRELADALFISEKTVSKWETGRGLPDIAVLPELARALRVSVTELFSGETVTNSNRGGNMKRARFYVCPICGNALLSVGESVVSCCGVTLPALTCEETDDAHRLTVTPVEDEWFVESAHPMEKDHYFSFFALCADDRVQFVKLYPEMPAETRFKRRGHGILYAYCNRHGLTRTLL